MASTCLHYFQSDWIDFWNKGLCKQNWLLHHEDELIGCMCLTFLQCAFSNVRCSANQAGCICVGVGDGVCVGDNVPSRACRLYLTQNYSDRNVRWELHCIPDHSFPSKYRTIKVWDHHLSDLLRVCESGFKIMFRNSNIATGESSKSFSLFFLCHLTCIWPYSLFFPFILLGLHKFLSDFEETDSVKFVLKYWSRGGASFISDDLALVCLTSVDFGKE